MSPTVKMIQVQWTHPTHGEVYETVCTEHEKELYIALSFLGIGYAGRFADISICARCVYSGHQPRFWIGNCSGS